MEPISATPVVPLIDCRGLVCPAPILKIVETVRRHRDSVAMLTVIATDPEFAEDVEAWCRATRAELVRLEHQQDGVIRAQIKLAPRASRRPGSMSAPDRRRGEQVPFSLVPTELAPPRSARSWAEQMSRPNDPASSALRLAASDRPAFRGATMIAMRSPSRAPLVEAVSEPRAPPAPLPWPLPEVEDSYPPSRPTNMHTLVRSPSNRTVSIAAAADAVMSVAADPPLPRENRAALLVLHNDLEALLAALMVANAAAAQNQRVEIYFSFWGIHLLRGERRRKSANARRPTLIERLLQWLVPRGSNQRLGKLHMGGIGTRILLRLMRKRNVLALDQLVDAAAHLGVKFRVCSMSMGLMGLTEDDIVEMPNIDFVGVASFAEAAARSSVSLVF